ncbi:Spo0B domain-containing protein [Gracilibacillus kekensis]|uniref:Stage 0 sporulation protein B (Sporulation initiation phosphotransferase) n=1 Tax=Gracilibacillus kekensis TaxID=1027249 RepID=A0A1M7NYJ8_9BACI|nr:Spo0B domain-containing protein [Gracilibacillus kekensis]SHN08890.1 stage 0 sporulation protein B (sporulation initiation phosphotransferase) [Gracilibacillus kekensis]
MKEQDVVEMLRHYRHDWLNDLQLILGYAQLGKLDKIQSKITDIIERSNQERGLDRLNIPKTFVWLYQLNWRSDAFELQFQSLMDQETLFIDDDALLSKIQKIFQILPSYQKEYHQYNGTLIFKKVNHTIHIHLTFDLDWNDLSALKQELQSLPFINEVKEEKLLRIEWQE